MEDVTHNAKCQNFNAKARKSGSFCLFKPPRFHASELSLLSRLILTFGFFICHLIFSPLNPSHYDSDLSNKYGYVNKKSLYAGE
jgi:hypothetical protein